MPLLVRAVTAARQVLPRRPAEILQGPLRLAAPVAASLAAAQPEAGLAGVQQCRAAEPMTAALERPPALELVWQPVAAERAPPALEERLPAEERLPV